MFRLDDELKVYVHRDAVDFRKRINGLAAIVEQSMKLDPFARAVYVFSNQRRDRIKMLLWDRNTVRAIPGNSVASVKFVHAKYAPSHLSGHRRRC
jgi:hypothetical protein